MGCWAWGIVHGLLGMGRCAWAVGHGTLCMGCWAWGIVHGLLGIAHIAACGIRLVRVQGMLLPVSKAKAQLYVRSRGAT